ncbi:MAG: formate dehydrogenase subunit delta [Panacagrimonas sp.]
MNVEHLVTMANDIGNFFGGEPKREDQIAGVLNHIKRFWDPRMRRQILAYVNGGGDELAEHVHAAVLMLENQPSHPKA